MESTIMTRVIDTNMSQSTKHTRQGPRTKVKSGCRTCKIRRVKCDEGKPACHRCVSTGRTCDGYGIWGGGGNSYGQRSMPPSESTQVSKMPSFSPSTITVQARIDEQFHFEWFIHRTSVKLPGAFPSSFWNTLALQASSDEPAVLHAVLALTSAHKREMVGIPGVEIGQSVLDEQEAFTLREYSTAIKHLHPHFAKRNRASMRVALVACFLFVCMENIRGHYESGYTHLKNGLNLLREMHGSSAANVNDGLLTKNSNLDFVDSCIVNGFMRLYVQARHFGQELPQFSTPLQLGPLPTMFESPNQARNHLDLLQIKMIHLSDDFRQLGLSSDPFNLSQHQARQERIQFDLISFHQTLQRSENNHTNIRDEFAYQLLYTHLSMSTILASTLHHPSPILFDLHTASFLSIITQSIKLAKMAASFHMNESIPLGSSTSHYGRSASRLRDSIADTGWIPPLFFAAVMCRVSRVRWQAVRLLRETTHREGVWDAVTMRRVAEMVVRIEEGDGLAGDDGQEFGTFDAPRMEDCGEADVPESMRISDVKVVVLDETEGKLAMSYRRQRHSVGEVVLREIDTRQDTR